MPVNFSEHKVVKEGNLQFLPCIDFNGLRSIRLQVCVFVKKINKKGWKHLPGIDYSIL